MVNLPRLSSLGSCLKAICGDRSACVGFSSDLLYQAEWVQAYNLAVDVTPAAVIRPDSADEVAAAVRCAADAGVKVQAKSGGHSYANFGLADGGVTVDLANLQRYAIDETTWHATIGAGMKLGDVDDRLHETGRAFAHGVCPGVGIGGHATIGGLGPMSRMWGAALDHIVEVEVVTANGSIVRASEDENADLFFGLRGAGASFGIITEFTMRTHPEPGDVVQFSFDLTLGDDDAAALARAYVQWQDLVADPALDRRFGTELVVWAGGLIVTGTFYGSAAAFDATGIRARLPSDGAVAVTDWLAAAAAAAEREALYLSSLAASFYSKSLGLRRDDAALSEDAAAQLFAWIARQDKGTPLWFVIFDATGGAVADVAANATAYAHRDKIVFYQSYGVGLPSLSDTTASFLRGLHDELVGLLPPPESGTVRGTYPGYVDLDMAGTPQEQYWEGNLPALERIKAAWDPDDVFHNPQSVRPAGS